MKMVVTGGGTGGHLFPGIAVAEYMLNRFQTGRVLFIGTSRQVDNKVLAGRKFEVRHIDCSGLKGKSIKQRVVSLFQLPLALIQAMKILSKNKPQIVIGVGGYVTGPVVLAAKIMGIPSAIHEQNSVPGLANRLLGRIADRIFLSIPGSESYFPAAKCVMAGNPVRNELLQAAGAGGRNEKRGATLLVLGGSQGAHALNMAVPAAVEMFRHKLPAELKVIHQSGGKDVDAVRNTYERAGISAEVSAFIDDMARVYREADLIVSRAGATTLAEITVMKKPAILIPFPFAADNHQEKNARYLLEAGAAIMLRQDEMNKETLGAELVGLLNDPARRRKMSEKAGQLAKPDATRTIMEECLKLAAA